MKKIVVIVVLLALIVGGALGGAGMAGIGPLAAVVGPKSADEAPAAQAALLPPRDIDLETIGVPLFEGNAVRSRLFLNVRVSVPGEVGEEVTANMPRLQDAFLSDLMAYMPRHLRDRDKVDLPVVQARLLKLARKVAGQEKVRGVTITHMFER